jgi:hypothetical protein
VGCIGKLGFIETQKSIQGFDIFLKLLLLTEKGWVGIEFMQLFEAINSGTICMILFL